MLLRSEVISVQIENENITGATVKGPDGAQSLQCCRLVIAAGSWSQRIIETLFARSHFKLEFDKSNRAGGNYLVFKVPKPSGDEYCHQVYVEDITGTPVEISDYRDGRLYVGGYLADPETLPATPSDVKPQSKYIAEKRAVAMQFVDFGDTEPEVLEVGRCVRPILAVDRPIIAKVPVHMLLGQDSIAELNSRSRGGVFVNTGHGTSGITLGPGSGLVLSELILGLQPSVDLSGLGLPL